MNNPIFNTSDFTLSVYTNEKTLDSRLHSYRSVLAKREQPMAEQYELSLQIFTENQPLVPEIVVPLDHPFFFENMKFQFEWAFKCNPTNAWAAHHLTQINEGFRFSNRKQLFGELNTANDIGQFELPICYQLANGNIQKAVLKFEVLPSKIDLHRDLLAIYAAVDEEFPLFRFKFLGRTTQQSGIANQRGNFPLFWLSHFKQLRLELIRHLKVILQSPHQRLKSQIQYERAEKLKGKLSAKRIAQVKQHIKQGETQHRYVVEKKVLSLDTPENRFIKNVVVHCQNQLRHLLDIIQGDRFSDALRSEMKTWQQDIRKIEQQSFLYDLEPNQNEKASLVLQQKSGYSQIYHIWQDLKMYLDFLGNSREVSIKSVAELYEIWCFIEIKNLLLSLGFTQKKVEKEPLYLKGEEYQLKNGFGGAFILEKADMRIHLAHEPIFAKNSNHHIKSYWNVHKPDILLQAELPNGPKYIWLFDAKYRLNHREPSNSVVDEWSEQDYYTGQQDYAPEDAINQMYRYRDALIYEQRETLSQHSRPIFGAFALYPGFFDQTNVQNPYIEAINEVGIGAFAFLPSEDHSGSYWLKQFLEQKLEEMRSDIGYLQKPQRIPQLGMRQYHYRDLLMTIRIGDHRSEPYIGAYQKGSAMYYHTKADFIKMNFRHFAMEELQYLAVAYPKNGMWEIQYVYPIQQVSLKKRNKLSLDETGTETTNSEEMYYLFSLGKAIQLANPILDIPTDSFRKTIKFSTLVQFLQSENFAQIPSVYPNMLESIKDKS